MSIAEYYFKEFNLLLEVSSWLTRHFQGAQLTSASGLSVFGVGELQARDLIVRRRDIDR